MKQSVQSINKVLFDVLEKLADDDLQGQKLVNTIDRANCITAVVAEINKTADTMFKAAKLLHETDAKNPKISGLLLGAVGENE